MTKQLSIGHTVGTHKPFTLPINSITHTNAILAIRGVGKTHGASVMAEEMLEQQLPIVVYDPTGAWWGLKSSADGKKAGYSIVVFGGEHADVPLEETAGETIATAIVENRIPAILDCSLMRKAARIRFMTDFCETLYHKNREPIHFFMDEAHTIAPQNVRTMPEAARLLGAIEDIVLQGRKRGLGLTVISQRPALLNTNVRSQCETLFAMRIIGPHDRKAIEEWIDAHGTEAEAKQLLTSLPALPIGDAWAWNPAADLFARIHFRKRNTFNSSATPEVGQHVAGPKKMAEVDLDKLGQAIKATVEKAKAENPKELRKRIQELERQIPAVPAKPAGKVCGPECKAVRAALAVHQKAVQTAFRTLAPIAEKPPTLIQGGLGPVSLTITKPPPVTSPPHRPPPAGDIPTLGKAEKRVLQALYWLQSEKATPAKVAFYAGYSVNGGGFGNAIGRLRTLGFAKGWQITAEGAAFGDRSGVEPKPTGAEVREWLRPKLSKAENLILDALVKNYPNRMTMEDLAAASGYSAQGGGFGNAVGRLRTLEAAEGYDRDGGVKASEVFFE
ncbi:MAG: ATP-binding protein [Candidatus Peribacteraceae bacterium]|nr:ATP-binding protein [Candidatus Peribacteraceae bacterium]